MIPPILIALLIFWVIACTVIALRTIFYWMNRAWRAESRLDPLRGEGPVIWGGRK